MLLLLPPKRSSKPDLEPGFLVLQRGPGIIVFMRSEAEILVRTFIRPCKKVLSVRRKMKNSINLLRSRLSCIIVKKGILTIDDNSCHTTELS